MVEDIRIPVKVGGVTFKNPFYVASGPTTKNVRQLQRIEETGWAAASIKLSIDPAPYINRKPRYGLFDETNALAFTAEKRLTFQEGLTLIEDAKKVLSDLILMANITYAGDRGAAGWVNMAKQFEAVGADIIELNMCCPNMSYNVSLSSGGAASTSQQTGASLGRQAGVVAEIVRAIKKEIHIPLFVKLTPEGGEVAQVAAALYAAGADAVGSTGNRLGLPPIDLDDPGRAVYHLQDEISMSCYCGSWLKPLAQRDAYEIRKVCGMEPKMMAAGGITDWRSAVEMVLCGGNLLGVCAETLISGYDIVRPMIRGLKDYMDTHGYRSIDDFCGKVVSAVRTAPELTLHDGYAHIREPNLAGPCKAACPHHVPVQAYVQSIARGDFHHAYELITGKGVLQGACAYICPHPCEDACVRGRTGRPVAIKALKRFVLELGRAEGWQPTAAQAVQNGRRAAVIGSGPAGLACADELRKAGYAVTIFEQAAALGGGLNDAVAAGQLPAENLKALLETIAGSGVELRCGVQADPQRLLEDGFAGVCAAVGRTGVNPWAALPGGEGVRSVLDMAREQSLYGTAAVIGPPQAAADGARSALHMGAAAAVVIPTGTMPEKKAALLRGEGITVLNGYKPAALEDGALILSGPAGSRVSLPCGSVWSAQSEEVRLAAGDGVFTAGGVNIIAAAASGYNAAVRLDQWVMGEKAVLKPSPRPVPVAAEQVLKRAGYVGDSPDAPVIASKEQAIAEAGRCLNCGCGEGCQLCKTICTDFAPLVTGPDQLAIDRTQCVACGMCYNRCPNKNIEMLPIK